MYAERRHVENGKGWRRYWDGFYWLIANYGIDLSHEFIATLLCLLIGILIFSRPGAIVTGESRSKITIPWDKALRLAVHEFLPLSLPAKPELVPSERVLFIRLPWPFRKAASYANFLHIVGWILVPLAVAGLTGLLRHAGQ